MHRPRTRAHAYFLSPPTRLPCAQDLSFKTDSPPLSVVLRPLSTKYCYSGGHMVFFMFLRAEEKMPLGRAAKVRGMYDVRNQASLILAGRHVGKYPPNLNPPDSLVMAPWLWNQWLLCSPLVTLLFFSLKMWEKAIKLSKELAQTYESRVFDYEGLGDLLVSLDQKMSFLLQGAEHRGHEHGAASEESHTDGVFCEGNVHRAWTKNEERWDLKAIVSISPEYP